MHFSVDRNVTVLKTFLKAFSRLESVKSSKGKMLPVEHEKCKSGALTESEFQDLSVRIESVCEIVHKL